MIQLTTNIDVYSLGWAFLCWVALSGSEAGLIKEGNASILKELVLLA